MSARIRLPEWPHSTNSARIPQLIRRCFRAKSQQLRCQSSRGTGQCSRPVGHQRPRLQSRWHGVDGPGRRAGRAAPGPGRGAAHPGRRAHLHPAQPGRGRVDRGGRRPRQTGHGPGHGRSDPEPHLARQHPAVLQRQALRGRGEPPLGPAPGGGSRRPGHRPLAPDRRPGPTAPAQARQGLVEGPGPRAGHHPAARAPGRSRRSLAPRVGCPAHLVGSHRLEFRPLAPGQTPTPAGACPGSGGAAAAAPPFPRGHPLPAAHPGDRCGGLGGVSPPSRTPPHRAAAARDQRPGQRSSPGRPPRTTRVQRPAAGGCRRQLAGARPDRRPGRAGNQPAGVPQLGRVPPLAHPAGGRGRGGGAVQLAGHPGRRPARHRRRQPPAVGRTRPGAQPPVQSTGLAGGNPALLPAPPQPQLPVQRRGGGAGIPVAADR